MKRFNLLEDAWIPVKTADGKTIQISACEIVRKDIMCLDAPRADFNAAIMQFLIGLIQTTLAPDTNKKWRELYRHPPSESVLEENFGDNSVKNAFYLDGDDSRFMQDQLAKKVGKNLPIEEMIFGAPGNSGKKNNKDHFIKKSVINGLCISCSVSAIIAANIFAEDGGQGYFQSMRGNGFISTLIQCKAQEPNMLWKNIWLNILQNKKNPFVEGKNDEFIWLKDLPEKSLIEAQEKIKNEITDLKKQKKESKNKEAKKKTEETIKEKQKELQTIKADFDESDDKIILPDGNYHQAYWAWMRRYLLKMENMGDGHCSLCNNSSKIVTHFYKTNKGFKYPKEYWQNIHPLSPAKKYQRKNYTKENEKYKDKMLAIEMTASGLPYIYWQNNIVQSETLSPAKVIIQHLNRDLFEGDQLVIWSFGYAMDSNSPLGWYESKTPLYFLDNHQMKILESEVMKYIEASDKVANPTKGYLSVSIRMAWFGYNYEKEQQNPKSKRPDPFYNSSAKNLYDQPIEISKCFWSNTENKFYKLLKVIYENSNNLNDEVLNKCRSEWYLHIRKEAEKQFDRWAFRASIQTNPKRIALAHKHLSDNLKSKSLKQETLGLP